MYTVYDYAERFIQRNEINHLPVNVKHIAKALGYSVQRYSQGEKFIVALGLGEYAVQYPSFSCYRNKKHYIFIRDGISKQEEQRLIAHELGHIEMHVVGNSGRVLYGDTTDEKMQLRWEEEADEFGLYIRAPLPLLCAMGVISPAEICKTADIPEEDAAQVSKKLSEFRVHLNTMQSELETFKHHQKVYNRRLRRKMVMQIFGVMAITLAICFGVFCLTASVFSGLHASDLIDLPESSASHEASSVAASSAAPESSLQLPGGEPEPSPDGSAASSQADQAAQSQAAAQQPAGYVQSKQPSAQTSSSQVYTPPASSSAPVVPPVSSAAPPASSAAPPESSSVPDYVIPVKPKEPLIEITPYTRYYWTGGGTKYHLFSDCYHIRNSEYQKESGLVADAKAAGKDGLCADCSRRNKEG